jgi:hypothetical protein
MLFDAYELEDHQSNTNPERHAQEQAEENTSGCVQWIRRGTATNGF